jgi:predicted transglutaminase-like cysteine proteinase
MSSEIQSAAVMQSYQKNVMGSDVDFEVLVKGVMDTCTQVNGGNLQTMEAMLVSQATALQTIFTDLARKAQAQTYQKQFEVYLGLALKAQAQSRATISALVDLKYPRQATFVKQANIAHGHQQVNNGVMPSDDSVSYGKKQKTEQNKLLEDDDGKFSIGVVPGKTSTPKPSHQGMEAVESVHRPKKRSR